MYFYRNGTTAPQYYSTNTALQHLRRFNYDTGRERVTPQSQQMWPHPHPVANIHGGMWVEPHPNQARGWRAGDGVVGFLHTGFLLDSR